MERWQLQRSFEQQANFLVAITPGRPAAIVTGTFRLRLKLGAKTVDKNLVLYNDVLVEDLEQQDVFSGVNGEVRSKKT